MDKFQEDAVRAKMDQLGVDEGAREALFIAFTNWWSAEALARGRWWAQMMGVILNIAFFVILVALVMFELPANYARLFLLLGILPSAAWLLDAFFERGQKFRESMRAAFWEKWAAALDARIRTRQGMVEDKGDCDVGQ